MVWARQLLARCVLFATAVGASPSWSLRRLSIRSMAAHIRPLESRDPMPQGSYGEMEVRPRLIRRIPGCAAAARSATLSKILRKDFADGNVIKTGDTVLVDIPAGFIGRHIYEFHAAVQTKGTGAAVLELSSRGGPPRSALFWRRPACRVLLSASVRDTDIVLKLKLAGTDISSKHLDMLSASLFDAIFKIVNNELQIAAAHQRLLERNQFVIEASERTRKQRKLQSIIEPEKFNRLTTAGPVSGAPRYKTSSSLQERRSPQGTGG